MNEWQTYVCMFFMGFLFVWYISKESSMQNQILYLCKKTKNEAILKTIYIVVVIDDNQRVDDSFLSSLLFFKKNPNKWYHHHYIIELKR